MTDTEHPALDATNERTVFLSDAQLLSDAITASGKSVRGFQRDVLPHLSIRSTWRYLEGKPMPQGVRDICEAILAESRK